MGAGPGERKNPAKENAACQVWLCTNIRYERVAPEGDALRPGRHLSDPRPLLCSLISVSPSLSLPFTPPLSSCLYRGKGDRPPFSFSLLWLQNVL